MKKSFLFFCLLAFLFSHSCKENIMRKIFSLFFLVTLFFSFSCQAIRTMPRVGRTAWTLVQQATPQPIEAEDAVGSVITIDESGNYQLYEDLVNLKIEITATTVNLDLNGHVISYNGKDENIISVSDSTVSIRNGILVNTEIGSSKLGSGIYASPEASGVYVESVEVFSCGNGIFLDGNGTSELRGCELVHLDFISCTTGVKLAKTNENIIRDCSTHYCSQCGYELDSSAGNCFYDCQALKTTGDATVVGFGSLHGSSNLFERCVAKETITSATDFSSKACAFLLSGTEEKTKILNCVVNETIVETESASKAMAYGIWLQPTFLESDELNFITESYVQGGDFSALIQSCPFYQAAWSPDGEKIIATCRAPKEDPSFTYTGSYKILYSFDGEKMDPVYFDYSNIQEARHPAWSPDNRFFATAVNEWNGGLSLSKGKIIIDELNNAEFSFHTEYERVSLSANIFIYDVAWSNSGRFLAAPFVEIGTGYDYVLRAFSFDGTALSHVSSDEPLSATPVEDRSWNSVDWSPDDRYIATSGSNRDENDNSVISGRAEIFLFRGSNVLTSLIAYSFDPGTYGANPATAVAWSPNGRYIAVGNNAYLFVLDFDAATPSLTLLDEINIGNPIVSCAWSPDGKYIISNASASGDDYIQVSLFDPNNTAPNILTTFAQAQPEPGLEVTSVDWSPSGFHILATTTAEEPVQVPPNEPKSYIAVYEAMFGPQNCVIENNTIADTLAQETFLGTGIAGGGNGAYFSNVCCRNKVDFSFGIKNAFYDDHNTPRPFDNIATQISRLLMDGTLWVDGISGTSMAMA